MLDKRTLTEQDIRTKYITPALVAAGWDLHRQLREDVFFTDGRIRVRGRLTVRGERKRADYILYYQPNVPLAVVEAKDNKHAVGAGIQQALDYARILDVPFVFSSNGDGFLLHDRTTGQETTLALDAFPSPADLWARYQTARGLATSHAQHLAAQAYYDDGGDKPPRYYQQVAINRTVEAIGRGQQRLLLVMATGTGKTLTAFQIVYRLWKAGAKKRILFLADRTTLIDQVRRSEFGYFGTDKMTTVQHRHVDKSYEIYLALYQGRYQVASAPSWFWAMI